MRQRLFPNLKRMTTMFCAGVMLVTFTALTMRLTFLSGMAVTPPLTLIQEQSTPSGDTPALSYQINDKIYFSSPDSKGNILIKNFETNNEYIRVDLKLNETGRSVYYSGDLKPGTSVDSVRLQGGPTADGVYECTATITVYSIDTKDKVVSDSIPVKLYIGVRPDKSVG